MPPVYNIRSLTPEDIPEMHSGFSDAFSDYKMRFKLNREDFISKFIVKLHIDWELSAGVFYEGKLVAFIFHSVNEYEGREVLYNGGTGIVPAHRGKKLVKEMYRYALPAAEKRGLRYSVLEVLDSNEKAIRAYESVGFRKGAKFKCFKTPLPGFSHINRKVMIVPQRVFQPRQYQYMGQAMPSFQDTSQQIIFDHENETILEAIAGGKTVGYIIYHNKTGRISQIAVAKDSQGKGIGSRLLFEANNLLREPVMTLINLRESEKNTARFLENRGFVNEVDQYEMTLEF